MTPKQFAKCLEQIGWTKRGVAERMGVDEKRIRRWSTGEIPVPGSVAYWLTRLADAHEMLPPPVDAD